MFEFKHSQSAKPGKDGRLPGTKVTDDVAAMSGAESYMNLINPIVTLASTTETIA